MSIGSKTMQDDIFRGVMELKLVEHDEALKGLVGQLKEFNATNI